MSAAADLTQFFGRIHPVLVHLPIGLLVIVAFLEVFARTSRFRNANQNVGLILALAAPMSVITAALGWLLSTAGGYEHRLLDWHKWTGIATAAGCVIAAVLHWANRAVLYRLSLSVTVVLLVVASHYGGSLTHGSGYLVQHAPEPLRVLLGSGRRPSPVKVNSEAPVVGLDPGPRPVFAAVIEPILQQNCVGCHGPQKSKGGLRMDSFEALAKGGETGPGIVPGKPGESHILQRTLLPPEHDDHMPPDGKPQPSADQLALLRWWVEAGAPPDKTARELNPPGPISALLRGASSELADNRSARPAESNSASAAGRETLASAAAGLAPKPLKEIAPATEELVRELRITIDPISETEPWLQCNASIAGTNFGDQELARLEPLRCNLRWLDLGGTGVTDGGLQRAGAMLNLTRLHLERTCVSDVGVGHLAALKQLQYLNLYGTAVTDAALDTLKTLPELKKLYVWQTKISAAGAKSYTHARTDPRQIEQWQHEIERLKQQIKDRQVTFEFGVDPSGVASKSPVNAECPVSGKPVDAGKTASYEGKLVAFCCDDCKAKFEKDPKAFADKIKAVAASPEPGKPINSECPISGKPVDPSKSVTYEGKLVAFCCDDCKAKFEKDPKPFADKIKMATASAESAKPINVECPVSGKQVDANKTVSYEGKLVAFCCDDCKVKFEKDPAPFLAKLGLPSKTN